MSEHTPTPWRYRPNRHDDWGWIRGPKPDGEDAAPLVAIARSGTWSSDDEVTLDAHRAAGTDPYGPNAHFIVKAVNNHDRLVEALRPFAWYFDVNDCNDREDHGDAIEVPIRDLRVAFKLFKAMGLAVTPLPTDDVGSARVPQEAK